jgi:hypothetical protein
VGRRVHTGRNAASPWGGRKEAPLTATDWIAGNSLPDLHATHHEALGTREITDTTTVLDKVVSLDLAWVVSALLQLLELRACRGLTSIRQWGLIAERLGGSPVMSPECSGRAIA